jgi:hypothetical protein
MSRYLHCRVCGTGIEVYGGEDFNYGEDCRGPYCDSCWQWQKQLDDLKKEIREIKKDMVRPQCPGQSKLRDPAHLSQGE